MRFNAAIEITYKCRGIIGEEETIFLPFYIFFRFFFFSLSIAILRYRLSD